MASTHVFLTGMIVESEQILSERSVFVKRTLSVSRQSNAVLSQPRQLRKLRDRSSAVLVDSRDLVVDVDAVEVRARESILLRQILVVLIHVRIHIRQDISRDSIRDLSYVPHELLCRSGESTDDDDLRSSPAQNLDENFLVGGIVVSVLLAGDESVYLDVFSKMPFAVEEDSNHRISFRVAVSEAQREHTRDVAVVHRSVVPLPRSNVDSLAPTRQLSERTEERKTDEIELPRATFPDKLLSIALELVLHPRDRIRDQMLRHSDGENFLSSGIPRFGDGGAVVRVVEVREIADEFLLADGRENDL